MSKFWLREAISDENNQADMAYIAIGILCISAVVALFFVCFMAAIDYRSCNPTTTLVKGDQAVNSLQIVPCRFDPLPIGQAAGLIFGAFAALIGSLAGYMAATRRPAKSVLDSK